MLTHASIVCEGMLGIAGVGEFGEFIGPWTAVLLSHSSLFTHLTKFSFPVYSMHCFGAIVRVCDSAK